MKRYTNASALVEAVSDYEVALRECSVTMRPVDMPWQVKTGNNPLMAGHQRVVTSRERVTRA